MICSDTKNTKLAAAKLIAEGAADQAIADRLGGGLSRMAVSRHRRNHLEGPARALAEAAAKGRGAVEQRAQMLAAAEAGDPSAFIALANIVADLNKVHERLERTANQAEEDGQRMAVAGLSAQQLRAAEVRARMGGVGGYGGGARSGDGGTPGGRFSINIIFPTAGRTETFTAIGVHRSLEADAEAGEPEPP